MAEITQKLVDGAGLQTAMGIMGNYSDNMDRGVVGGYNQSFPLTAATKGNIYYHKPTNRYYICINNYSGSSLTNPNSNFEELSVYTNRQRLDNLIRYKRVVVNEDVQIGVVNTTKLDIPNGYHLAICIVVGGVAVTKLSSIDHAKAKTYFSYSYEANGTIYYSKTNDDRHRRYAYIIGILAHN